ncbi:MAG: dephospho-CoA kinase [Clostridiales bacterium]|nr:dephospho-CoA kinase [Clostridiales bacterium]
MAEIKEKNMRIAVTGGIGSGKSEVMAILKEFTPNVLSADAVNAALLTDGEYLIRLKSEFPEGFSNGLLDKKSLSVLIFSDPKKRERLNAIAHPLIMKRIFQAANEMSGHVFIEVPLLTESVGRTDFDRVWLVRAATENRIKRLKSTRNMTDAEILSVLKVQASDDRRESLADEIIDNDGGIETLRERVVRLFGKLKVEN